MPLEERVARWRPMLAAVREGSARAWCRSFLRALAGEASEDAEERAAVRDAAA